MYNKSQGSELVHAGLSAPTSFWKVRPCAWEKEKLTSQMFVMSIISTAWNAKPRYAVRSLHSLGKDLRMICWSVAVWNSPAKCHQVSRIARWLRSPCQPGEALKEKCDEFVEQGKKEQSWILLGLSRWVILDAEFGPTYKFSYNHSVFSPQSYRDFWASSGGLCKHLHLRITSVLGNSRLRTW